MSLATDQHLSDQKRKNAALAVSEPPSEITQVFRCCDCLTEPSVVRGPEVLSGPDFHAGNQRRRRGSGGRNASAPVMAPERDQSIIATRRLVIAGNAGRRDEGYALNGAWPSCASATGSGTRATTVVPLPGVAEHLDVELVRCAVSSATRLTSDPSPAAADLD